MFFFVYSADTSERVFVSSMNLCYFGYFISWGYIWDFQYDISIKLIARPAGNNLYNHVRAEHA